MRCEYVAADEREIGDIPAKRVTPVDGGEGPDAMRGG
jgi:hypothetical protein